MAAPVTDTDIAVLFKDAPSIAEEKKTKKVATIGKPQKKRKINDVKRSGTGSKKPKLPQNSNLQTKKSEAKIDLDSDDERAPIIEEK